MPPITALLHTENDALRLGRCLETLYPCDHILIVDHGSRDRTVQLAREYGARVITAAPGTSPDYYLRSAAPRWIAPGWILALDPRESLTESLAASLFEWKSEWNSARSHAPAFSVFLREETAAGWLDIPAPQTRLVPHSWNLWNGSLPGSEPSAPALDGELLRFVFP
jgi:glycosyltransferase involved in cell wall biosynthesis